MSTDQRQLWEESNPRLEQDGELELPWIRQAFDWLLERTTPPMSHFLDVGCGPAVAACLMAQMSDGTDVTGVDASPGFVRLGTARAARMGLSGRVRLREGDVLAGLDVPSAGVVWAAHVVHHLSDPVAGLAQLGRLVCPGGIVAVAEGGLPMRVLPAGYGVAHPSFVSRLEACLSDYFIGAYDLPLRAVSGGEDWPPLMTAAGLVHQTSQTFLLDLPAPLEPAVRAHLIDKFTDVHELVGARLDPADAHSLGQLIDPDDPMSLHRRPDLFVLAAHTVHLTDTATS